ncbi:MAG: hypothetical protein KJZ83_22795 [Burkholderiaceae bacterium]|nr:hypothetical protein [Burkholderiaceae bacterium]
MIDGVVIDDSGAAGAQRLPVPAHVTRTLMRTAEEEQNFAQALLPVACALDEAAARRCAGSAL